MLERIFKTRKCANFDSTKRPTVSILVEVFHQKEERIVNKYKD